MPVIVRFDVPVSDKANIEKHLQVTNSSGQKGAWHWLNDSEVHWRPVHYWKPGTDVTVKADINSIPAGNGIYGQLSRTTKFHIGQSVISKVNMQTHRMKVFVNGKMARNIPITTGQPGFTTRSGIKVIVEKFRHKRMDSETIGIAHNDPQGYDLDDVEYAMRVTYSGEFVHAAPWSVGSQGYANVSHGCTGMSTANAGWLYSISKPRRRRGLHRHRPGDDPRQRVRRLERAVLAVQEGLGARLTRSPGVGLTRGRAPTIMVGCSQDFAHDARLCSRSGS